MFELAAAQPGFLGVDSAREDVGITVSYWTDEAAIAAWKAVAEHLDAQRDGRARWYDEYEMRIARVERGVQLCARGIVIDPPERVDLEGDVHLRLFRVDDADEVARAVKDNLDHLKPWMPWADEQSGDPEFQRERLRKLPALAARGEEWQYGLFGVDDRAVLGSFGLMTRRGPGTIEIGYWLHGRRNGSFLRDARRPRPRRPRTRLRRRRSRLHLRRRGQPTQRRGRPPRRLLADAHGAAHPGGAGRARPPDVVRPRRPRLTPPARTCVTQVPVRHLSDAGSWLGPEFGPEGPG